MSSGSGGGGTRPGADPDAGALPITPQEQSEIEELRRLLLPTERERLERVEERVDELRIDAESVGGVIAEALEIGGESDPEHLDRALQEPVARAMHRSVREDPQTVADALFPVMGPAIRKAIVETVRGMIESTNRAIEAGLSLQGLQWRLEAWRSGKPFAEIVLLHSLVYRVEQLLLIHKESGLLLRHVVAPEVKAQDPDMVSGMLTAIRDFVRDSFGSKSGDSIDVLQVGELEVLVEDSPHCALAAVVRGHPPPELRVELEQALEAIERRWGEQLAGFDGDTEELADADHVLGACLRARYDERHPRGRGAVRLAWVALALALALGIGWWASQRLDRRRWSDAVAALDREPGVVVTGIERHGRIVEITGLRDPLAVDPNAALGSAGVDPARAALHLEPYQSLEPAMVERRRRDASRAELEAVGRRVAATSILMALDSTEILPASLPWLPTIVAELRSAQALAAELGLPLRVELTGHTDLSGDEQRNELLSEQRAAVLRDLLVEHGLPTELFTVSGAAARAYRGDPSSEESHRRNRRVDLSLRLGPENAGDLAPGRAAP